MSRGDVADYLGLTVETVSRLLSIVRSRHIVDAPVATEIVVFDRESGWPPPLNARIGRKLAGALISKVPVSNYSVESFA